MISLERYAALLREPGLARVLPASIVGRLPIGMATLAILLSVQAHSGSFARSGSAAACYVLGLASVAPLLGRLIDRLGPGPVLAASAVVYPAALGAFVLFLRSSADPLVIAACVTLAGAALPPITIAMRALFPRLLSDIGLLQSAYSLDSALVEFVFIVGPAVVAGFAATGYPDGAVMLAAVCAAGGTVLFLRCAAVRGWTGRAGGSTRKSFGALRVAGLSAILATTVLYSIAFGLFEVAVMAFAAQQGAPAAAGVVLALASVGSAAGAVCYGSRSWSPPLARQYVVGLMLMASGIIVLAPLPNIVVFALASIASGAPMAPVIAVQSLLISRVAPREMLAESFTWGATCLLGGVSAGIALGGIMAESVSPRWILIAAAGATALAAVVAWVYVRDDKS